MASTLSKWAAAGIVPEHTIHPDVKKFHKSYSTSAKDIREKRSHNKEACALCFKLFDVGELRRCGKCIHISYCSKECQKKDWSVQ
ncbi:hypothetical protein C8J57DRAFT_1729594 [Mycena rebaudengoi]|nr:hypothetical protein C8J57DRAFT_1729594 [Mycena rebaudengoi]